MTRTIDLSAAERFIALNARVIDRRRYAFLFQSADAATWDALRAVPVVEALRAYQNADGGFAYALEPDGRGSRSQPLHALSAMEFLDEAGAFDHPVARAALDYLASIVGPNGGVPPTVPPIGDEPRPPWWNFGAEAQDGSLLPTGEMLGRLFKNGVDRPWMARATELCWSIVAGIERTHPYEIAAALQFLDHVPDRARAEREAERLGEIARGGRLIAFDLQNLADVRIPPGYKPGEVHTPLDYALLPTSLARRWFSDDEIARDLDALAGAQRDDGGWMFRWGEWNAATTIEWRGWYTIRALKILSAYGALGERGARAP